MKVKRPELTLLKKIFMVDLIKGLLLTFSYQKPSENITEQYPKVRPKVSERFRGAPRLNCDPDTGETYYSHWLNTLEKLVAEKGVTTVDTLHRYRDAWDRACDRTPHGQPIELRPDDFR